MEKLSFCGSFFDNEPMLMSLKEIEDIVRNDEQLLRLTAEHRMLRAKSVDESLDGVQRRAAKSAANKLKQKFPVVIPAADCRGGKKREHIACLMPWYAVDIDHVDAEQMAEVRQRLQADEHVAMVCSSPSGQGLRALCPIDNIEELQTLWDKSSTAARTALYRHAWKQCAEYIDSVTGVESDPLCANPEHAFTLTHDDVAYFCHTATPLHIDMSTYEEPHRGRPSTKVSTKTLGDKRAEKQKRVRHSADFKTIISLAEEKLTRGGVLFCNGRNDYLYRLASICNTYGMKRDELLWYALSNLAEEDFAESEITATIDSAYRHVEEHGTRTVSEGVIEAIGDALHAVATFRYNTVTNRMELLFNTDALEGCTDERTLTWHAMQDRDFKTLYTYVRRTIRTTQSDVDAVLFSHGFAPDYHPLRAYIEQCEPWKEGDEDYIRCLFDHIDLVDESQREVLYHYFHLWFVRVVALALGTTERNQLVPALVGEENTGKSFFWENILPPELCDYYQRVDANERIDKDMLITLSQKLIVNFDERRITKRESDTFKSLIGGGIKSVRMPYGRQQEQLHQHASIVLTSNELQYIGTSQGNRRYISINVRATQNLAVFPIPYEGLYAQAFYEITHNKLRESLTRQEVAELKALNAEFTETDVCEDAILTYYELPTPQSLNAKWVSATEVRTRINNGYSYEDITPTRIGATLSRLGFKKKRSSIVLYFVVERDLSRSLKPDDDDDKPF